MSSESPTSIRAAYASAVAGYKPWHQHGAWNASGRDAFWQLIDAGLSRGIFTMDEACKMFDQTPEEIARWGYPDGYPDRRTRIKVWKRLKRALQISS